MFRKLVVLALVATLAAPLTLGDGNYQHTYTRPYDMAGNGGPLLGGLIINIIVYYGGVVFPAHPHDTTATVTVYDYLNGGIDAIVCQDLNSDSLCDTRQNGPDRWACAHDGSLTGFDIEAAATPYEKQVYVFVYNGFWTIPECDGHVGEGTSGTITVTYA